MQRGIAWIVDDDSSIRWVLERALTGAGLSCTTFESGNEVLDALTTKTPDVLLSDIRMPGMDGLALLKQIKQRHPMLPVIIMTAHSDLDAAVSAYQQGAFDYLPKPFDIDEAVALVDRAISHYQEQQQPRNAPISSPTADIIGEAPAMQDVFRIIGRLSRSSISVLINGESGTGKELVAHALHRHSPRSKAPFIALNMAAIPKDLIESELFGHEKEPLPAPIPSVRVALNRLTAVRCSWMKLAICRLMSRLVCCACWRMVSFIAWAVTRRSRSMCGSSPLPTRTWNSACRREIS